MFKKILIANRGEIALRIIRTCKEMGIRTVAVYSTADKDSLHVRFADEAVCIGKPQSSDSYLNIPHLMAAAEITNADAIHPGYGFLAENARFAEICGEHGIKFIGPTPDMIRKMGDKMTAKETMIAAGVPLSPVPKAFSKAWKKPSNWPRKWASPLSLKPPQAVVVKVCAWYGTQVSWRTPTTWPKTKPALLSITTASTWRSSWKSPVTSKSRSPVTNTARYATSASATAPSSAVTKSSWKSLPPFMTPELREKMGDAAIKAASAINYESVGTIEFLVDKHRNFYFMEMNTRIQVEHGVTEEVINFDLIKEQIKIAAGIPISGKNYTPQMHAIECRINAEDPHNDFRPSPGRITVLHTPGGHGVRVDSHIYAGYVIPPYYDSMVAKVIAVAQTREEAINTMERALSEFVIEGVKTTIPFHQQLMQDENFRKGNFTTKFTETFKLQ